MIKFTINPKCSATQSHDPIITPYITRKDDDKKDKPDRKKKAPRPSAKVASKEDEGWTTVSGTDKVTKVSYC